MSDERVLQEREGAALLLSIQAAGFAGAFVTVTLPLLVSAVGAQFALPPGTAAHVAAVEMGGVAVGSAVATLCIARPWRALVAAAAAILALANGAAIAASSFEAMLALRAVAGVAAGALLALMSAAIGRTRHPDRSFAAFVVLSFLGAAIAFRSLPGAIAAHGVGAYFVVVAALAAAALLLAIAFPAGGTGAASGSAPQRPTAADRAPLLLALGGVLCFYTGIGAVWALMARVGAELGLADGDVTRVLSATSVAGLCAALGALVLGARAGRQRSLYVGMAATGASLFALSSLNVAAAFAPLALAFVACWNFTFPYLMSSLADLDRSGRTVAFNIAIQYVGFSLGPLLGSAALAHGTRMLLAAGAVAIATGAVCMYLAIARPPRAVVPVST